MNSKNSIVGDSIPTHKVPEDIKPEKIPRSDWEKMARTSKYKAVHQFIEARKEYYRHYLPDGTKISEATDEQAASWWKCAAEIISEYENFQQKISLELDA